MIHRVAIGLGLLAVLRPLDALGVWEPDGVLVCGFEANQTDPVGLPDGSGGAFFVWADARNGGGTDLYAQRVDALGHALWTADGVTVCTAPSDQANARLLDDGAGGMIIAWTDARNFSTSSFDIYAQRVDGSGTPQWPADGVAVCTAAGGQYYPKLAGDGAGGVILVWDDYRGGSLNSDVYAARVSAAGAVLDGPSGIAVSSRLSIEGTPSLTPYGGGGAIIAWTDTRNGVPDIYAARFSSGGVVLDPLGIPVCQVGGDQQYPAVIGDGAGGAIIAWADARTEGVFAQRLDAAGAVQWPANGVAVGSATGSPIFDIPRILPDGAGGAVIAWTRFDGANKNIYAQRLDSTGEWQWLPSEAPLCTHSSEQRLYSVAPDAAGGLIAVWEDNRDDTRYDIYAQRVTAAGSIPWTPTGVAVSQAALGQKVPIAVTDAAGGAIVAWQDSREFPQSDIYAHRIGADGQTPTGVDSAHHATFATLRAQPNPFARTTELAFRLDRAAGVSIEIYDVAGRRVRKLTVAAVDAGWQRIQFDGRDQAGRLLASGVYVCRIDAPGARVTQKLVLAR